MSDFISRLDNITELLMKARISAANGNQIDLGNLQKSIEDICLEMKDNPPNDEGKTEEKIKELINELNLLAHELSDQLDKNSIQEETGLNNSNL